MEAKLKEYRARKRRTELLLNKERSEEIDFTTDPYFSSSNMTIEKNEDEVLLIPEEQQLQNQEALSETSEVESLEEGSKESWKYSAIKWSVIVIIWTTLFYIFLNLQFGAVYFVVSILIGICLNTRTRPRKLGEVSAYSVFNENCKSIDGTLTSEQFEREIRYGPGSVR